MHTSIGKPLVALCSAACLAIPATIPTPQHHGITESSVAVNLTAAATTFDPVPPSARLLSAPSTKAGDAELVAAVGSMVELSGVETGTLLLQLLSAPFHNAYAVSIAVGKAVNAVLQLVSLPFSVATYVLTNRTTEIPAYIQTVRTNLGKAVPGIFDSVRSEIQYDMDLLAKLFGNDDDTETLVAAQSKAALTTAAAAPEAVDRGTLLLQLATFPFHNIYAVSIAVGKAVNAVVQLFGLPLSAATYVLTNRTAEIPTYINTVRTNLSNAFPGIVASIQSEIDYNKNLFSQVFGGDNVMVSQSRQAATVLAADSHAAAVFDTGVNPLDEAGTTQSSGETPTADTISEESTSPVTEPESTEDADDASLGSQDSGTSESGTPDSGTPDSGTTDSETSDSGNQGQHAEADPSSEAPSSDEASGKGVPNTTGGKHRRVETDTDTDTDTDTKTDARADAAA